MYQRDSYLNKLPFDKKHSKIKFSFHVLAFIIWERMNDPLRREEFC